MYLSNVLVNENMRGNGLGNKILEISKKEALLYGANSLILKCKINHWTHDWYLRHGYENHCLDNDETYIWLKNMIKNKLF